MSKYRKSQREFMITESVPPNYDNIDEKDFEVVGGVRKAHSTARRMSEKYPNALYEVTGKPGINEEYFIQYVNGIPTCPPNTEFVAGYRKSDGTYVHPFCRTRRR